MTDFTLFSHLIAFFAGGTVAGLFVAVCATGRRS
jgi:hypothetical protein